MEIREETLIEAPLAVAWPRLKDVNLIADCIPGATLDEIDADGRHHGSLTVQFGPTRATFRGSVLLNVSESDHRVDISGRGTDNRGRNRASVELEVRTFAQGEKTKLELEGDITVSGPLESFASTGGRHLAQELLKDFTSNMTTRLESVDDGSGLRDTGSAESGTQPLGLWRLLWRSFRSWLRSLWRRSDAEP